MRTLFEYGFQKEAWKPTLGLTLDDLLTTGTSIYKAQTQEEIAEEQRKAAEAQAAAAQAQAQAAMVTAQSRTQSTVFGIPTTYLIVGGVALGLVAIVVAATRK
jgi:hypothetical protein